MKGAQQGLEFQNLSHVTIFWDSQDTVEGHKVGRDGAALQVMLVAQKKEEFSQELR